MRRLPTSGMQDINICLPIAAYVPCWSTETLYCIHVITLLTMPTLFLVLEAACNTAAHSEVSQGNVAKYLHYRQFWDGVRHSEYRGVLFKWYSSTDNSIIRLTTRALTVFEREDSSGWGWTREACRIGEATVIVPSILRGH